MFEFDPHLHCLTSGHGTTDTISDLAKHAAKKGLNMIGVTDHGPATICSGKASYFRSLASAPKKRCGIDVLYGVELNILDYDGTVDLSDEILQGLDYAIISMHMQNIKPGTVEENTYGYINAMKHPKVKILGHCDDVKYPVDYDALMVAAMHYGIIFEINNFSLSPDGYRGDTRENAKRILNLCKKNNYPIVLSSDSHGKERLGNFKYALEMLKETEFPDSLILNYSSENFKKFICQTKGPQM